MTRAALGTRQVVLGLTVFGLVACGGAARSSAPSSPAPEGAPTPEEPAPTPPPKMSGTIRYFEVSPESLKADHAGLADGPALADGAPDVALALGVEGPADAIFVSSTDARGEPNGEQTADTIVGLEALPETVGGFALGKHTPTLAVLEGGRLLNTKEGALRALPPGKHDLVVYVGKLDGRVPDGLRVAVRFTDGSVVKGPVAKLR